MRTVGREDPACPTLGGLDPDSAEWVQALASTGPERDDALAQLHKLLLRVARAETRRRAGLYITADELDDLAHLSLIHI